jgi:magnesium transporter
MNTDTITIRSNVTVDVLLKYLRRMKSLPDQTDKIFVTDRINSVSRVRLIKRCLSC